MSWPASAPVRLGSPDPPPGPRWPAPDNLRSHTESYVSAQSSTAACDATEAAQCQRACSAGGRAHAHLKRVQNVLHQLRDSGGVLALVPPRKGAARGAGVKGFVERRRGMRPAVQVGP
jgi:hypothetical protein